MRRSMRTIVTLVILLAACGAERRSSGTSVAAPRPTAEAPGAAAPPPKDPGTGPTAAVRAALEAPKTTTADDRERLLQAFQQATACAAVWCGAARTTLQQWIDAGGRATDGTLTSSPIACTDAGCWTVVETAPDHYRDLTAAIDRAQLDHGWPGLSIVGGADTSRPGIVTSFWALARP